MKSPVVTVGPGHKIKLSKIDADDTGGTTKEKALERFDELRAKIAELQQILAAEHQRSLLLVFQAMDTGGKDGAIKDLCAGLNPAGIHLTSFKAPSSAELDHDFLWRIHQAAPGKGMIGIWNRSHYEDVLVPKVHRQISEDVWLGRCEDINAFERLLSRNGVTLLKFFLHISKEEQKERLQARLADPNKLWKFNPGDLKERALWEDYQLAYEAVINECATAEAPWHVVPANRKWVRNLVMLETVVAALEKLNPKYPDGGIDPKTIVLE
jgi:PPK2 family polyphosphate:nucleotide phosphotransferase